MRRGREGKGRRRGKKGEKEEGEVKCGGRKGKVKGGLPPVLRRDHRP